MPQKTIKETQVQHDVWFHSSGDAVKINGEVIRSLIQPTPEIFMKSI